MMSTNLMNGTEQPDFYASANQSDLFKVPSRDRISYHEDGRVMMDGKVVEEKDPEQMWRDLIVIMMTKKINRYSRVSMIKRMFSRAAKKQKEKPPQKVYITTISIDD